MLRARLTATVATMAALGATSVAAGQARKVWTQEEMFRRNVGTKEEQVTQFPPHKVIGNVYYVGTKSLASFLVTTPQGHILINTNYEAGLPALKDSIAKLGFQLADIKIILGSHAHGDHMEADATMKELTGAQVMAMAEDVPALERMRPGGKPHPIDRVLHDGDTVSLGGVTLKALLTPGHTKGCTTWTMTADEGGRSYQVAIVGSMGSNPGFRFVDNKDNPRIADEYKQGFKVLRTLKPDVPLASHPAMYRMVEKYERLQQQGGKGPNPFIDPQGYVTELDDVEGLFNQVLTEQLKAAGQR